MKKLDEKELKDVNGGTLAPAPCEIRKCKVCGEIFTLCGSSDRSCPKCHSTNTTSTN